MSDLRERLKTMAHLMPEQRSIFREAERELGQAADEIASLRAQLANMVDRKEFEIVRTASRLFEDASNRWMERATKAEAQLASARKALEPFAALAEHVTEAHRDSRPIIHGLSTVIAKRLTVGHLRAAKAALTDEQGKS